MNVAKVSAKVTTMTDDEHDQLTAARRLFWIEFSSLCEKHLSRAPTHLRQVYEMSLGEVTSIYGRKLK